MGDASWREAAWSAWQRGDKEGKNEACRLVWPVLFRIAKSWGLSEHEAEEIVQDVLLSILCRHLPEWVTDSDKLAACLYTAILNRVKNSKTRRRNNKSLDGSQGREGDDSASDWSHPVDQQQRPDQQLELSETGHELEGLTAKLSGDEREVLILRIYMKWTFERIAEVLGLPLGTVGARYRRAIDKLGEMPLRL